MAENYGSLEGVLNANETLEGEIDSHDEMSGKIQFSGGVGGVKDVQVNNESVVDVNKVAHIDLTPYAEKEDVYDKQTIDTALEGKADIDDIPENITDLSDVEVSNIQNGQVLKWDSNQKKFVNANESGGSGDVTDVKVNGTSVVDPVTKEANIDLTGYAEKSDLGTASSKDVPATGNASANEVVLGNDTRLSDSRPASDVSSWAKASTKPDYTASEVGAIATTAKGTANGVAELDENGKVPSAQLPSYVDDVLEYSSTSSFPVTGESGKIYVALETNKTYRWGGTEYVEISESLALGETSSTAYRGDRGKAAYDHSQLTSGNPHNVTKSDIGLGNVDNTSDSTKKTNFTGSIASGNTGFTTGGDVYTALGSKADKVSSATNGNLAGLNGSGNPTDSGWNGAKDTTSISGNPISISELKSNQLAVNPIITFEPIQAGSGTPSPSNIRAISGYDKVEVESCGKNICDNSKNISGGYYETTGWKTESSYATSDLIPVKPNTIYSGSLFSKAGQRINNVVYTLWSDENTCYQQVTSSPVTTDSNTKYIRIRNFVADASYITGNNYLYQLEEGSTASTTFYLYNKATSISESLGQTVYWGRLNVRTGEFEVLGKIIRLNSLQWGYVDGYFNVSIGLPADCVTVAILHGYKCFSSKYNAVQKGYLSMQSGELVLGDAMWSSVVRLIVKDSRFTDVTSFTNSLTNDDTLVYPLATPFTIQLTPHEISLLKDYAYVSTNGTNIALDYHNGELASLADTAQVGETLNELEDKVSANDAGTQVNLMTYNTSTNKYVCPSDGYISLSNAGASVGDYIIMSVYGANDNLICGLRCDTSVASIVTVQNLFVKRGMKCYVRATSSTGSFTALFTQLS